MEMFLKHGRPYPASFHLFSSFHHSNNNFNNKIEEGVLGFEPGMVGTDETTEPATVWKCFINQIW